MGIPDVDGCRSNGLTLFGLQSRFGDTLGQTTWNLSSVSPKRDWSFKRVDVENWPNSRTAVSFRGETILITSVLFQKRDCS